MYKKNQGYGICGSKNIYSSNVRVDNWVEDNIGMDLANTARPQFTLYSTVTSETHIHPKDMPPPRNLPGNMPSVLELKTKNKEGMSYEMLFEHDSSDTPRTRFQTQTMIAMTKPGELPNVPSQTLLRQKSKAMIEDINRSYVKTTEYRLANAHLKEPVRHESNIALTTTELPNFKRQALLTSQFPGRN